MTVDFYAFVDDAVRHVLPPDCLRAVPDNLPGKHHCKISHAFHVTTSVSRYQLAYVLVLPYSLFLTKEIKDQIIALRDAVFAQNDLLVVISEEKGAWELGDVGEFVWRLLPIDSPNSLWIVCKRDRQRKATIDRRGFCDLYDFIRLLYEGAMEFSAPTVGINNVCMEIMLDICPKCQQLMKTFTGIVFPDRQLDRWDNGDWHYYNTIITPAFMKPANAWAIWKYIHRLRKRDRCITPVGYRYSKNLEQIVFTAICPHCKAHRVEHKWYNIRESHMGTHNSRMLGLLEYHSISLNVNLEIIKFLTHGYEPGPHTCPSGWRRRLVTSINGYSPFLKG
ncbi:hypothetical protein [Puia dinghuensis]|uniref:hypothetical protein n=1 Tax=Puia dinghuensis TaxID=1792502 RepID=UPI001669E69E|nr:hypothetical protein [Puia dinghuensis]